MPKKAIATRLRLSRLGKGLAQRRLGDFAFLLELGEVRALAQLDPHPDRDGEQDDRQQEGNPPAPGAERFLAQPAAGREDDQQRGQQAERGGGLDPAGRRAALVVGGMLGDVDRRAAIFAAQRRALADAQEDEQDRGKNARLLIGRKQADGEGRAAHQADGGEEGRLAADPVAHRAEDDRAQRPEGEADREQRQRRNQRRGRVEPGQEHLGDDRASASRR